jgi:3-dehydroquinate synthase class II
MTKMIEKRYGLSWQDWTRVPVERLIAALQREKARVLAAGNTEVLVDIEYDWENRAEIRLIGLRPETPEEQASEEPA